MASEIKIPIKFLYNLLNSDFSKNEWGKTVCDINAFETECGIVYKNQEINYFCYKVIDEKKCLLAKIKYGL